MPLKKGSSRETVSTNVKRLVREYEETGTIGKSHPASKGKAVKQAVAIALTKAGRSRKQTGGSATAKSKPGKDATTRPKSTRRGA